MARTFLAFSLAALCEIAGCYSVWMWLRLGRSPWWLAPGIASLALFAIALTWAEAPFAGRAFAAYGGVYIVASLLWARTVEGLKLDAADLVGATLCLLGALVLVLRRSSGP